MRWGPLMRRLGAIVPGDFRSPATSTRRSSRITPGIRAARRLAIPVVATYHTFFEEYLHHYVPVLPRRAGRWLARHFTRSQCAQVDALISPSEPMRSVLSAYGVATPVHVIPTGLPPERFRTGRRGAFSVRASDSRPRKPLLLFVGRIAHEKNIEFLIEMFALLRKSRADARFVIAGEGPARPSLQAKVAQLGIAEHVTFVGNLDREQGLADCYAAAATSSCSASRTENPGTGCCSRRLAHGHAGGFHGRARHRRRSWCPDAGPPWRGKTSPSSPQGYAGFLDDPAAARAAGTRGREYAADLGLAPHGGARRRAHTASWWSSTPLPCRRTADDAAALRR